MLFDICKETRFLKAGWIAIQEISYGMNYCSTIIRRNPLSIVVVKIYMNKFYCSERLPIIDQQFVVL